MRAITAPPDGSRNDGAILVGVIWGEAALTLLFLIARATVKIRSRKAFSCDDGFLLVAVVGDPEQHLSISIWTCIQELTISSWPQYHQML